MINHPLVSICIPTYNSALFLEQTLNAIAAQTYKNIEVIISDNASTDETPDIIKPYCDRYGWTFYRNEVNIGAGNNFNKLIELANGEYIAIYHADDIYDPTIVEKSVYAFQQSDNIGLIGTMGQVIDSKGKFLYNFKLPYAISQKKNYILSFESIFEGIISTGHEEIVLITPSIMVKKEIYTLLGNFKINEQYKSAGDYEMWLRIANHYSTYIIEEKLIQYRIHPGQGSELEVRQNLEIYDIVSVLDDYLNLIKSSDLKGKYVTWRERLCVHVALKQNAASFYAKSSVTLKQVKKIKFLVPKILLSTLNLFKVSLPLQFLRKLYSTIFK